jgi:G:T-mismatch repair DNA endonuclease (very short patch repair protein)
VLSEEARRNIMSRIRSRDKKPELAVRSAAHAWDYDFAWAAALARAARPRIAKALCSHLRSRLRFWHQHTCKLGPTEHALLSSMYFYF